MGKVRQIKGIMNVNQILESQSPKPTVYTKIHTAGLEGYCREQRHRKAPDPNNA